MTPEARRDALSRGLKAYWRRRKRKERRPPKGAPGQKRLNVRLTDDEHVWLSNYARELGLSRGAVVRMLIEQERELFNDGTDERYAFGVVNAGIAADTPSVTSTAPTTE